MTMTEKQKKFCDYFIETGNATKSAIFAGYSEKTAKVIAAENLTKPNIRSYIEERLAPIEGRRIATGDDVLEYLPHGCDPETVSAAVFQSMANAQSAGFAELNA